MFGSLGLPELMIIGLIVALIFGPRQLPKMGKALGDTVRELRGAGKEIAKAMDDTGGDTKA